MGAPEPRMSLAEFHGDASAAGTLEHFAHFCHAALTRPSGKIPK
jgi:hypothetical protein